MLLFKITLSFRDVLKSYIDLVKPVLSLQGSCFKRQTPSNTGWLRPAFAALVLGGENFLQNNIIFKNYNLIEVRHPNTQRIDFFFRFYWTKFFNIFSLHNVT